MSHSVEVINLLSKLEIPINLSSQPDECLKELRIRKEKLLTEMEKYKQDIEEALHNKEQLINKQKNLNDNSINSSNIYSDNNSDISSCLDSNYESDNNSVRSNQSNFLFNINNNIKGWSLPDTKPIVSPEAEYIKESVDQLGSQLTLTSVSIGLTNSDDSDVTINESSLNEKELKTLSDELVKNQTLKNKNSLARTTSNPNPTSSKANKSDENKIDIKNNFNFFRQISDGYSSSCTPLSASSISEQPSVNPFFLAASTSPATVSGLIQTSDPIETAFFEQKQPK